MDFLARAGTSCLKFLVKPRNSCVKQELLGFTKKINLGSSTIEHKILQISAFYLLKRPKLDNSEDNIKNNIKDIGENINMILKAKIKVNIKENIKDIKF